MKRFWLYLEPQTFIFRGDGQIVFYNSINGAYHQYLYLNHSFLEYIVDELEKTQNGYGIFLDESELSLVQTIVDDLRNSMSGDCIPLNNNSVPPFIFKPHCRIIEERMKALSYNDDVLSESFGIETLTNLNEVTIFLGAGIREDEHFEEFPYYRQFIHSMDVYFEETMSNLDYIRTIEVLCSLGIGKLNVVLNKDSRNQLREILPYLSKCDFKICFYLNCEDLKNPLLIEQLADFSIVINIHIGDNVNEIIDLMGKYQDIDIVWNTIISSEEDIDAIEPLGNHIVVTPYYNGSNEQFFKDYVYSDINSILKYPIDRQTIFRRKTLNENFFGKLYILPNGDSFSNMNTPAIGNVRTMSLAEIVFKEMECPTAWFKLREEKKCANCCNRYLCPSISNYELVIGKPNLCHIKP